jgi:lon-related putative ATP-dependent protease
MPGKSFITLPVEKLRWRCDRDCFPFETTSDLPLNLSIIGQERAIKAIKLGLSVNSPGYNIYAQGLTGTGKETTVKQILAQLDSKAAPPGDKCYVHNFDNPDEPIILYLPRGQGAALRKDMDALVEYLVRTVPAVLESEDFQERRKAIIESASEKGRSVIKEFEERIRQENFVLVEIRMGPMTKTEIAPLVDGKPRTPAQLEQLFAQGKVSREEFERIQKASEQLGGELEEVLKQAREVERQIQEALKALVYGFGAELVAPRINDLKNKYEGEKVRRYLENVRHDLLENLEKFTSRESPEQAGVAALLRAAADPHLSYRVNVLVDNSEASGAPIIIETHPTYKNLFGTIERTWDRTGQSHTDFTRIKAGSLLRADGGYLVLSLLDVLAETGVYQALKRTLKNNKVDIQGFDPLFLFSSTAMKPEAIDVNVKVVLIGDAYSYQILWVYDPDFRKIFKVKSDFDTVMERTPETVQRYAEFVRRVGEEEKLPGFDRGAVAGVVEYGVRLAGRQSKLSARFSDLADIVRESAYWAREMGSEVVREEHVDRAVAERVYRLSLVESKIQELIEQGVLMIVSDGARIGQVNGLSVYSLGDYAFGRPSRITAAVSMGRGGIINIEREADLSGKTHNKGMLILAGYFRQKFAIKRPLAFSASLAFEQSYSGVEGDSAASTELYALLSALSEIPLRQDIAVTGSVNQMGEIQAIGGVNEKIEGFYDVCRARELTGRQGVAIPEANVADLMLRKDVIEAVAAGKFHVYPVRTIEEGIELLTGVPAGERGADGNFPEDSVYGRVEAKLIKMAEVAKEMKESKDNSKSVPAGLASS